MYQKLLGDIRFYDLLFRYDHDLAKAARKGGCGWCGGRLDSARYPRKPRGGPEALGPEHTHRLSFCCAKEGCRRRLTPPSVRFLGRRVFLAAVVVLVPALREGARPARVRRLRELLGVSARTLTRWRRWWRTAFAESRFWKMAGGQLGPRPKAAGLPRFLLQRFPGDGRSRLIALLRFLAPITTESMKAADPQNMRDARSG